MYEVPASPEERPGCRDALLITRAVFGAILPAVAAMVGLLVLLALVVFAFAVHPALALLPGAGIVVAFVLFALWARGQAGDEPPPDP